VLGAGPLPELAVGVRQKLEGRGGQRRVSPHFCSDKQGPSRPLRARPPSRRRYGDCAPAMGAMATLMRCSARCSLLQPRAANGLGAGSLPNSATLRSEA